jgi:hypothetical protein
VPCDQTLCRPTTSSLVLPAGCAPYRLYAGDRFEVGACIFLSVPRGRGPSSPIDIYSSPLFSTDCRETTFPKPSQCSLRCSRLRPLISPPLSPIGTSPDPTMSVATMLQPASRISRASSSSSSSFQPVARQNTMSSHDTRSIRQSKRMSVTALYLSMSAKDRDLEISDDLARGTRSQFAPMAFMMGSVVVLTRRTSPEISSRAQDQDFVAVEEELCLGEGRAIPRFADCAVDSEPNGAGRGKRLMRMVGRVNCHVTYTALF